MKLVLIYLSILFFYSCSISTQEQRDKFERCKKIAIDFYTNPQNQKYLQEVSLVDQRTIEELKNMSLDEIITKHNISYNEIDRYISLICACEKIKESYDKLENNLKQSNDVFKKNDSLLNTLYDSLENLKVKPIEFERSKYFNSNDTSYIDEKGNIIKIKVAKYE